MAAISVGDRVRHQNSRESFGEGTVQAINLRSGTVLVDWDSHALRRISKRYTQGQSHVNIKSLTRLT